MSTTVYIFREAVLMTYHARKTVDISLSTANMWSRSEDDRDNSTKMNPHS